MPAAINLDTLMVDLLHICPAFRAAHGAGPECNSAGIGCANGDAPVLSAQQWLESNFISGIRYMPIEFSA